MNNKKIITISIPKNTKKPADKKHIIGIRLFDKELLRLSKLAKDHGYSRAEYVRLLINQVYEQEYINE